MEFRHVLENYFVSSFLLSLLPGCMESGYLVTSLAGDPVAAGDPRKSPPCATPIIARPRPPRK